MREPPYYNSPNFCIKECIKLNIYIPKKIIGNIIITKETKPKMDIKLNLKDKSSLKDFCFKLTLFHKSDTIQYPSPGNRGFNTINNLEYCNISKGVTKYSKLGTNITNKIKIVLTMRSKKAPDKLMSILILLLNVQDKFVLTYIVGNIDTNIKPKRGLKCFIHAK